MSPLPPLKSIIKGVTDAQLEEMRARWQKETEAWGRSRKAIVQVLERAMDRGDHALSKEFALKAYELDESMLKHNAMPGSKYRSPK